MEQESKVFNSESDANAVPRGEGERLYHVLRDGIEYFVSAKAAGGAILSVCRKCGDVAQPLSRPDPVTPLEALRRKLSKLSPEELRALRDTLAA